MSGAETVPVTREDRDTASFIHSLMANGDPDAAYQHLARHRAGAYRAGIEAAAKTVRERLYPKNPQSDWTEFAKIRAEACDAAEAAIRALTQEPSA